MVVTKIVMPKLGLMMTEGRVTQWFKKEGERVEKGEPLFELETEKITKVVEAWGSGVLRKIVVGEGGLAPVSETIGVIAEADEELPADIEAPVRADAPDVEEPIQAAETGKAAEPEARGRLRVSPVARKLAKEHRIDVTNITGTGPRGRVVKADVLRAIEEAEAAEEAKTVEEPKVTPPIAAEEGVRYEPMSTMRKMIAERLLHSYLTAAHVSIMMDVDMTEAVKLRQELIPEIEKRAGVRLSYTDIIVKVVAKALREHLIVNSTLKGNQIQIFNDVNVAVAVALEKGLIVPVIREADRKSLTEISSIIHKLVEKARQGSLSLNEVTGGTFTITNLGMYEVDAFAPIINPPQAAILGIGRIAKKPVVIDNKVAIRTMMTMTLRFDHRIIDGALAAEFLRTVKHILENPHLLNA